MHASRTRSFAIAAAVFCIANLILPIAVAQEAGQKLQAPPSASDPAAVPTAFRTAVTVAIITGTIAFAGTLVALTGTILNARSQRRSIERQLATQQVIQERQFASAMQDQLRQFEQETTRRKEDEDRRTRSLIISVAIDAIVILARTEVYADQVKGYTEITEDNTRRLRISLPSSLNPDWQHAYLFVTAKALGRIRRLTTIVERANRWVDLLNSFRNQKAVVSAERFKGHLNALAEIYAGCAKAAEETIAVLQDEFSGLRDMIGEADNDLRLKRRITYRPGAPTEDGGTTSSVIIRHPFDPEVEP